MSDSKVTIKLGDRVRDRVSGLEGVVVMRSEYLNGCVRYGVQPVVDKDGKMPDSHYIDEMQIEVIGKVDGLETDKNRDRGGPVERIAREAAPR